MAVILYGIVCYNKTTTLFEEINEELSCTGIKLCINSEYAPEYLKEAAEQYAEAWQIAETIFVHGRGHRKTTQQLLKNRPFGYFYANQDSTYGFYPKYPVADAGYGSYNNKNRTVRINRELTAMHQEVLYKYYNKQKKATTVA